MKLEHSIDPIIPFEFYANREAEMLDAMRELKRQSGLRRFLLTAPGLGVRLTGFPDNKVYQDFGELLLRVKNAVAGDGIEVGWWCAPSLKSGKAAFQRITGIDGQTSDISSCPLDEGFAETFSNNVATVARIAKPFMIQFEDDYELSNHIGVSFGCFCPLHLKEFEKRTGTQYSREDLMDIFSHVDDNSIKLRRQWAEMSRDSLTGLARCIRDKIDEVSAETRISLCQAGCADFDGNMTEAVGRAFAGKTRPTIRLRGSNYSSDSAEILPSTIFSVHYFKENLPEDFELMHESDTYPHTRFFMSASKLKSLISAALSYGLDNSLLYALQYLDNPLEESGYFKMFKAKSKKFDALKQAVADCKVKGCQILSSPWEHIAVPYNKATGARPAKGVNPWVQVLGRHGIPYTAGPGNVKLLAGEYAQIISDEEIKELLKTNVMMDGRTAFILSQRGFFEYIGVEVMPGGAAAFCHEGISQDADFQEIDGKLMYNFIFAPAGSEGGSFYELKPLSGTKILTEFLAPEEVPVVPGMTRFENSLGGRVAVTAFDLENNRSSAVFNYRKKEILRQTLEWLGKESLPVFVKDLPNVFCIYNESLSGNMAVITLINLSSDTAESISLDLPDTWKNCKCEMLACSGDWNDVATKNNGQTVEILTELKLMTPIFIKLQK
jgi:hypothetical protein